MGILIVTKDRKTVLPTCLRNLQNKKVIWKNKLSRKDLKEIELVITIGGDGTFLSAAHFIEGQLILGVNQNPQKSEGCLTSINLDQLEKKLEKILKREVKIKEYTRESVKILKRDRCIITENALNETYFGNQNPHHPSNYEIQFGKKRELQRSSGVLISTGTGSTAWYKAMKGWKFGRTKKQLRFRIRELFHGRLLKPKIKKGKLKKEEKLTITSKINHGILAIDSIRTYPIRKEDKIEVFIGKPLKVIQ